MKTFQERALDAIKQTINDVYEGNVSSAAESWGIPIPTLLSWVKGSRIPSLKNLAPILDLLGADLTLKNTIQKINNNAEDVVVSDNPTNYNVPVLGDVGAGIEAEFFALDPEYFITIPLDFYRKNVIAFKVCGDSMEPRIKMGSYVGIIPFDGNLREGAIYLVNLPPFGRVIKFVHTNENGEIVLVSANPNYRDRVVPYEGYEHIIIGQVIWSLRKEWEF